MIKNREEITVSYLVVMGASGRSVGGSEVFGASSQYMDNMTLRKSKCRPGRSEG